MLGRIIQDIEVEPAERNSIILQDSKIKGRFDNRLILLPLPINHIVGLSVKTEKLTESPSQETDKEKRQ